MKVEGDAPDPETVAIPEVAADKTLQVNEADAVSTSVAFKSGAVHAVGFPSSDIETDKGPVPCVITGASFMAVRLTLTVMLSVRVPSETWTTKLSFPLKFAAGA